MITLLTALIESVILVERRQSLYQSDRCFRFFTDHIGRTQTPNHLCIGLIATADDQHAAAVLFSD